MLIRPARPEDALRIATIHVDAWRAAYRGIVPDEFLDTLSIAQRSTVWKQILESRQSQTWIAEDGDTALGWISAAGSRDAGAAESTGEIWAVYIDPGHWREGVGTALCDFAEQELQRRGSTEVTLWVLQDNQGALAFYVSRGFVQDACDERVIQRGGKDLREVRLRKRLS